MIGSDVCSGGNRRPGDLSTAESCKAKANEAFKAGDFDGAIAGYSGAIKADPNNPVYFSNRAMAHLKVSLSLLMSDLFIISCLSVASFSCAFANSET